MSITDATRAILDPAARERLSVPRWVYGDVSAYALSMGCPCCGSMGSGRHIPCAAVECMLCGSVQCHSNGAGDGHCRVCFVGFLPGWSGTSGRVCGYAGCGSPAVATVRKRAACRDHAMGRVGGQVRERLTLRDSGGGWQRWVFTGPRVSW